MKSEDFTSWTIATIRADDGIGSWLEERKFDWVAVVGNLLNKLINNSTRVIVTCDDEHEWFLKYIMTKLNNSTKRPHLPFFALSTLVNRSINTAEERELAMDMLNISFDNNFVFWYIGKYDHPNSSLAKMHRGSFLWLLDEEVQNGFTLYSADKNIDQKLLQMYKLFDKSIDAVIANQIEL